MLRRWWTTTTIEARSHKTGNDFNNSSSAAVRLKSPALIDLGPRLLITIAGCALIRRETLVLLVAYVESPLSFLLANNNHHTQHTTQDANSVSFTLESSSSSPARCQSHTPPSRATAMMKSLRYRPTTIDAELQLKQNISQLYWPRLGRRSLAAGYRPPVGKKKYPGASYGSPAPLREGTRTNNVGCSFSHGRVAAMRWWHLSVIVRHRRHYDCWLDGVFSFIARFLVLSPRRYALCFCFYSYRDPRYVEELHRIKGPWSRHAKRADIQRGRGEGDGINSR